MANDKAGQFADEVHRVLKQTSDYATESIGDAARAPLILAMGLLIQAEGQLRASQTKTNDAAKAMERRHRLNRIMLTGKAEPE